MKPFCGLWEHCHCGVITVRTAGWQDCAGQAAATLASCTESGSQAHGALGLAFQHPSGIPGQVLEQLST